MHKTLNSSASLSIVYRSIGTLKRDPKNARKHRPSQVKALARSIKAVGFNVPVLVDKNGNLIAGHCRVDAAQLLDLKEIPTILLDHLSEEQIKAFKIADNRLAELAEWDDELLTEQLKMLSELDLTFDLEVTGFTMGEIDLRIEGLTPAVSEDDPADQLPPLPPGVAISKGGDLWLLGKHRLLCGTALERSSYQLLMDGKLGAAAITDPPFNVRVGGHVGGLGDIQHREFIMASGEMSEAEFISFLTRACSLLAYYSIDGSLHYVFMDWRHLGELLEAGRLAYTQVKNLCVWVKDNAGMGSLYRSQHELILVFKHGRAPHRNNVELGKNGRYRTNIWQYAGANSFARKTEEGNLLELHPTVKPVAMIADAILDCTARGDIVLDPFLGSGTTLMAAERTSRICFGMELDPLYVDTIIRRWQAYTGDSAIHATTGRSFDEIVAEMEAGNG